MDKRIPSRTKACKMAFFRTAGGAALPRPGRGARSRGGLGSQARATQTKARSLAGSRTPGPARSKARPWRPLSPGSQSADRRAPGGF